MNRNYNKIKTFAAFFLITVFVTQFFTSCKKDDDKSGAVPEIQYIRMNDPLKADSLLVSASLGDVIVLMGKNLGHVQELWFNDKEALLNTSYITDATIVVTIPQGIPEAVSDSITIVTSSGIRVQHPFRIQVPAPAVRSMKCEYVEDGDEAIIYGNFFLQTDDKPLQVFFPGNIEAEVTDVQLEQITVKVPTGLSASGPVSVKSLYGKGTSSFYFRDDRNVFLNWDDFVVNGWGKHTIGSTDALTGNYVHFTGTFNFGWHETMTFLVSNKDENIDNTPYYSGDLFTAALKFEINSSTAWQYGAMQFVFASYDEGTANSYFGDGNHPSPCWEPWQETGSFQTDGWQTVTIPLSQFKYNQDGSPCDVTLDNSMLGGFYCFLINGTNVLEDVSCEIDIKMDNFRIVPL